MIKELLEKGLQYSLANPSEFAKAYKVAFGETVCSYCPGKIEAKFKELLNVTEEKLTIMKEKKWRMIPGKLIDTLMSVSGPQGQYTNKNITDELAEQLIAKGYGKYFIRVDSEEVEAPVAIDPQPEIQEEEITFEILEKSEPSEPSEPVSEEPKKDSFDTYSFTKLVKYCESKKFDKKEWENLNRKKLIEYVRTK
jgi:hypothetical protein